MNNLVKMRLVNCFGLRNGFSGWLEKYLKSMINFNCSIGLLSECSVFKSSFPFVISPGDPKC